MTNANHRNLNTAAWIVLMIALILYGLSTEDRLEECSDMLYKHLYEQDSPEGVSYDM